MYDRVVADSVNVACQFADGDGRLTIDFCDNKLSMKVGTKPVLETVPCVRSTGPKPIIPSTPSNPEEEEAAPKDCFDTVRPAYDTGPIFSVPETLPDP